MRQSVAVRESAAPIERPCGQYKIHQKGHSLTVTVPKDVMVQTKVVVLREGIYQGQTIYLKAIPFAREALPSVATIKTDDGITEEKIGKKPFSIREANSGQRLTIPAACQTDRFGEATWPMVVSARDATGIVSLKYIPECLYEAADSTATADLLAVDQPDSPSSSSTSSSSSSSSLTLLDFVQ